MRLMVHAAALDPPARARMRLAALGLALRGHEVLWRGEPPPGAPACLRSFRRGGGVRADLVLGHGPIATALAGWQAGVDGMVLDLDLEGVRRWSPLHRWCWESLHSHGLLDARELDAVRAAIPYEAERFLAWSDAAPAVEPDAGHPDTEILERGCERMLSRRAGARARPAVFLDRDGTLVVEKNYLSSAAGLELVPDAPPALRLLRAAGFALVVISNQSGVGRGLFTLAAAHATMAGLRCRLRGHGIELDAVHFCPHRPDQGCSCRKPGTALIEAAVANLRLDLRRSYLIGDKLTDVAAGQAAGAHGVLVRTGYGREEERRLGEAPTPRPPAVFEDLGSAAGWIAGRLAQQSHD